ncbi:hypothetical protein NDU88_000021 [Pleurodeles waltl]|uniref:Uncharacterized protein n=1 Tax=Pleurodeles waltl TaxID=8319 RepID=A0AAV7VS95_PLEWA|nr:hypothetical protein NDU88_000021 [Pleurodeles waltl]
MRPGWSRLCPAAAGSRDSSGRAAKYSSPLGAAHTTAALLLPQGLLTFFRPLRLAARNTSWPHSPAAACHRGSARRPHQLPGPQVPIKFIGERIAHPPPSN